MNSFEDYPVLTLFSVNKPLTEVTEAVFYDICDCTCDASEIPQYIIDALGPELLGIGKAALYDLRRKTVEFDLGWGYRRQPMPGLTMPALYWTPLNCPGSTAILVNCEEGNPNLLTSSTPYRDWDVLWTYIDDADSDDSVCWIQFTGSKETVYREVWCGYSADDEKHPRWRFDEYGPLQPFEDATSYRKKRIKDRLTRAMIGEYFARFGSDIRSPDFWKSSEPAWVFWRDIDGSTSEPPYEPEDASPEK
jgi:hypothetical protein